MCQRRTLTLSDAQRQQLLDYRDHHPKPYVRERAAALLHIADGVSPHAVARAGLLRPRHPDYAHKRLRLMRVLGQARRHPGQIEAIFLDEMGYSRWPDPGPDYGGPTPVADRRGANNGLWRLIGGLNARTGRLDYLDAYIVGRAKVIQFYGQLVAAYPKAERLYVIQDNWSIHTHADVLEALKQWPQICPVWLPTYAPWLNPIEKVWRWLRQDV